jgi:hypothetical protein
MRKLQPPIFTYYSSTCIEKAIRLKNFLPTELTHKGIRQKWSFLTDMAQEEN